MEKRVAWVLAQSDMPMDDRERQCFEVLIGLKVLEAMLAGAAAAGAAVAVPPAALALASGEVAAETLATLAAILAEWGPVFAPGR